MTSRRKSEGEPDGAPSTTRDPPDTVFDIGAADIAGVAARGAPMELRHPSSGRGLGIFFLVCGHDSNTYRDANRRVIDAISRDNRPVVDASVNERRAADMFASLTLDWWYEYPDPDDPRGERMIRRDHVIPFDGEYTFSPENALNLYFTRRWVREQVENFVATRANFFPDSPTSSVG